MLFDLESQRTVFHILLRVLKSENSSNFDNELDFKIQSVDLR